MINHPIAQKAPIAPVLSVRWHRSQLAETDASDLASAACYRLIKDSRVIPVVVAELKFGDVQRHVLGADSSAIITVAIPTFLAR